MNVCLRPSSPASLGTHREGGGKGEIQSKEQKEGGRGEKGEKERGGKELG